MARWRRRRRAKPIEGKHEAVGCLVLLAVGFLGMVSFFASTSARSPSPAVPASTQAPAIVTTDPAQLPPPPAPQHHTHRHHHPRHADPAAPPPPGPWRYPRLPRSARQESESSGRVWVNGYCRRDGRCVRGHWRRR